MQMDGKCLKRYRFSVKGWFPRSSLSLKKKKELSLFIYVGSKVPLHVQLSSWEKVGLNNIAEGNELSENPTNRIENQ